MGNDTLAIAKPRRLETWRDPKTNAPYLTLDLSNECIVISFRYHGDRLRFDVPVLQVAGAINCVLVRAEALSPRVMELLGDALVIPENVRVPARDATCHNGESGVD